MHGHLLIGFDFSEKKDTGVLIVGNLNLITGTADVINVFQGEEAMELYKKLTTRKEND